MTEAGCTQERDYPTAFIEQQEMKLIDFMYNKLLYGLQIPQ